MRDVHNPHSPCFRHEQVLGRVARPAPGLRSRRRGAPQPTCLAGTRTAISLAPFPTNPSFPALPSPSVSFPNSSVTPPYPLVRSLICSLFSHPPPARPSSPPPPYQTLPRSRTHPRHTSPRPFRPPHECDLALSQQAHELANMYARPVCTRYCMHMRAGRAYMRTRTLPNSHKYTGDGVGPALPGEGRGASHDPSG